jgi:undecaprenyl-diphosphatase
VSELGYGWAVLLGLIQGLTEFLPVSSSAHLALSQKWIGLDPSGLTMLLFDLLAHVGTVISIFIVFREPIARYARRATLELGSNPPPRRYALRIAGLALCALIPTGVIGLGFKDKFEAAFADSRGIGIDLLITGALLAATALVPRGWRGWKDFHVGHAVLIGIAQGIAIMPGISRSGSTICTATFLGIRRRWAAEFSFYIAIPAILAAAALKLKDALELNGGQFAALPWGPILLGSVVSLIAGVVSLWLLLGAVRRARLHYFALYCWLLGGLVAGGAL